jgi:hypothetical protein
MEIEGVDPEWKAVPVPIFECEAGEKRSERAFFKPPRVSESAAGDYPFVIRVRSLVSGETQTAQGVLQVRPFNHLAMEISPKRGVVSPTRKQNSFEVSLVNMGNTEHTIRLMGSDAEDECTYEFESDQVALGPGAQRQIEMVVNPKRISWLSSGRLFGITVTGRSVDGPNALTSSQTQLEQRPLFSPATLAALVLVAILFFAWILVRPKPSTIAISVDPPMTAVAGQTVTITWQAAEADRVQISVGNGKVIYDGPSLAGSRTYIPGLAGPLTIVGKAGRDGRLDKSQTESITVSQAPQVDKPEIIKCEPSLTTVKLHEPFVLKYQFNDSVTKATLGPDNIDLNLSLTEQAVTPQQEGENDYTLVVQNSKGEQAQKSFTVMAVEESDAHILAFEATPHDVTQDNPHVTLNWQVTNSARVELKAGSEDPVQVDPTDRRDFVLSGTTTFILTAIDANNRRVSNTIRVKYIVPKPFENPINPQPSGGPTSGSGETPPTTAGSTSGDTAGATAGAGATTAGGTR